MAREVIVVSMAQLRARNWSPQQIETLVRRGTLVRAGHGMYVRAAIASVLAAEA